MSLKYRREESVVRPGTFGPITTQEVFIVAWPKKAEKKTTKRGAGTFIVLVIVRYFLGRLWHEDRVLEVPQAEELFALWHGNAQPGKRLPGALLLCTNNRSSLLWHSSVSGPACIIAATFQSQCHLQQDFNLLWQKRPLSAVNFANAFLWKRGRTCSWTQKPIREGSMCCSSSFPQGWHRWKVATLSFTPWLPPAFGHEQLCSQASRDWKTHCTCRTQELAPRSPLAEMLPNCFSAEPPG